MIILQIRNPDDEVTSYNQIRIYRSSSQTGVFTLLTTVAIDITTRTDQTQGYTQYTDSAGDTNSWYKVSYYNSSSAAETDKSDAFQGGTSDLDAKIRRRMKDTNVNKYFFSNEEIADARDMAIQSLWPATWIDTTYEVTITDSNKKTITVPYSVFRVDKIKVYDTNGNLSSENYNAYYKVGNKIYAIGDFPTNYVFRFIISKPYTLAAECPFTFENYLVMAAELELLRVMETDRSRYYRYTSSIKPEGGNLPSLSRIIDKLEISMARRRNELRRFREANDINLV
ncbi:MAG: hypothetical protein M1445_08500 [Bacteroidetes bacterium]|nr:hypothetical protein [Bacteroidota bacterium]